MNKLPQIIVGVFCLTALLMIVSYPSPDDLIETHTETPDGVLVQWRTEKSSWGDNRAFPLEDSRATKGIAEKFRTEHPEAEEFRNEQNMLMGFILPHTVSNE